MTFRLASSVPVLASLAAAIWGCGSGEETAPGLRPLSAIPYKDPGPNHDCPEADSPAQPFASTPVPDVAMVELGVVYGCLVDTSGNASCWGSGPLGCDGWSDVPVPVMGLPGGMVDLATGEDHACALDSGGRVYCWGNNLVHQLGIGSTEREHPIVDTAPVLDGVTAIDSARNLTCALREGGTVWCWGSSSDDVDMGVDGAQIPRGGRGRPSAIIAGTPVQIRNVAGATAISVGGQHGCAILGDGRVMCWGGNDFNELGDGTLQPNPDGVYIASDLTAAQVSAGSSGACLVTTDGRVACWGNSQDGMLGLAPLSGRHYETPTLVEGLAGLSDLSLASWFSCGVRNAGGVACWGRGAGGVLGDPNLQMSVAPVDIATIASAVDVVSGVEVACAVLAGDQLQCWGDPF